MIDWTMEYGRELIKGAHYISYSLDSEFIKEQGLYNMISLQLERIRNTGDIETTIEVSDDGRQLSAENSLMVYRIAQEALNNIVKHARAPLIQVNVFFHSNLFRMTISDNGIGFKEEEAILGGLGISHMKQRAKLLGGELNIRSRPGLGCKVELAIRNLV